VRKVMLNLVKVGAATLFVEMGAQGLLNSECGSCISNAIRNQGEIRAVS
jgi:hypothetical protein